MMDEKASPKTARPARLPSIQLVLTLTVLLVLVAIWGTMIYRDASRMRSLPAQAKALKAGGLQGENLQRACALARSVSEDVSQLQADLVPLLWASNHLGRLPFAGHFLVQADPALDYLASLSGAGMALCKNGLPLWQEWNQPGVEAVQRPSFIAKVAEMQPDLDLAEGLLKEALEDSAKIDPRLVPAQYRDDFAAINEAIPPALHGLAAARELPAALKLMEEAQALQARGLDTGSLEQVSSLSARALEITGRLKVEIQAAQPLLQKLDPGSRAGQYLSQAGPLIDYLASLAQAGAALSQSALPLVELEDSQLSLETDPPPGWFDRLAALQPGLAQAQDLLSQVAADRARIDASRLPPPVQAGLAAADRLLAQAQEALPLLQAAPQLLGGDAPRTYLILIQNRDELRASGGFITAFGLLKLDQGRVSIEEIKDSLTMNSVSEVRQPPEPMREILQAYYLVARDANWSPDFPTAARQTQEMYALSTDIQTDGVIALDQGLLSSLLEFSGPLALPDGSTVDAGSLQPTMVHYKEAAIRAGNADERKDFMLLLAPALIDRIKGIQQPAQQLELARLVYRQARKGHLQVFFNDAEAQRSLTRLSLDGAVRPAGGDYLMLADSNLSYSKADAWIERSLTYQVDLSSPRSPSATVRLRYRHTRAGTEPCHQGLPQGQDPLSTSYYFPRCYWDYWRLLAAGGTRLRSARFDFVPASYFDEGQSWKNEVESATGENGAQVFAGLVVVPQGQEKEVVLTTQPPQTILTPAGENRLVYRLRIQKQAGIERLPVKIQVSGPAGYALLAPPAGWSYDSAQNLAAWQGEIEETQDFTLEFAR